MAFLSYTTLLLSASTFLILHLAIKKCLATRSYRIQSFQRGCNPPPYIPGWGITRLLEAMKASREDRMPQYVVSLLDSTGPDVHTIDARMLTDKLTVTRDPANVETIFASQAADFDIGPNRENSFKQLLGVGVTTARGERWKHGRALLRPQFSREQISDLGVEERHVRAMLEVMEGKVVGQDGWTAGFDLQPILSHLTHKVAIEMLYGEGVNVSGDVTSGEFSRHLDAGKSWLYERMMMGKFGWLFGSSAFRRHCKAVHAFVDGIVRARSDDLDVSEKEKLVAGSGGKFVFLDELAKHTRDPLELRNETLHVLSASWDTTAALIGWVFYFLARNPEAYRKLRKEVETVFAAGITFANLKDCHYLNDTMNEAFRCAGVIPVIERMTTRNTTLPRGGGATGQDPIYLPKDSRVLISTYGMQMRSDIWGNDPEKFSPERWSGRKAGYEFVPFAGGPRKCIGRNFALLSANGDTC